MNKLIMVSLGLALLLVAALLAGCGGDTPAFVDRPTDVITGHWVLAQQAPVPTTVQTQANAASDISILYTGGGLPRWSGDLKDHDGTAFNPNQGEWSKDNGTYRVTNSAGQWLEFVFEGSRLRSTTVGHITTPTSAATVTPTPMYQWWTRT